MASDARSYANSTSAMAIDPSTRVLSTHGGRSAAASSSGASAAASAASRWRTCSACEALADAARRADLNGGLHHRAKVKRVIQLFMNGGVSQMDTFDYKPELIKRHGQTFDPGGAGRGGDQRRRAT